MGKSKNQKGIQISCHWASTSVDNKVYEIEKTAIKCNKPIITPIFKATRSLRLCISR